MSEWKEKEDYLSEIERMRNHDCLNNRDECDFVHPNMAKISIYGNKNSRPQPMPPHYRRWMLEPKVGIYYLDQHELQYKCFNVSQAFAQMSSGAKLNVVQSIIYGCLSKDERSLLFSDLGEKESENNCQDGGVSKNNDS